MKRYSTVKGEIHLVRRINPRRTQYVFMPSAGSSDDYTVDPATAKWLGVKTGVTALVICKIDRHAGTAEFVREVVE